jgi:hypothetical protein
MLNLVSIIIILFLFSCESPREVSRNAQQQQALRATREAAVRHTENNLIELDQLLGAFRAELRDGELKVNPEIIIEREQSLLDKRILLDDKVQRYNNAVMSGSDIEAADLKAEINREIELILNEMDSFKKERQRLIEP